MEVPVVLQTEGAPVAVRVPIGSREESFTLSSAHRPLALHVDPAFDLFRALDPLEIPPSIGQIFGEPRPLAVLPAAAAPAEVDAYRGLIEGWRSEHQQPEIVTDREVETLPADRAVWLLGRSNRLAAEIFGRAREISLRTDGVSLAGQDLAFAGHSLVVTARHPANPGRAVGWIVVDPPEAFPGLARKLPHYGKYSYLGFEGAEPTNVVKGQWSGTDSPMTVDLRPEAERTKPLPPLVLEPEPALVAAPAASGPPAHPGARPGGG